MMMALFLPRTNEKWSIGRADNSKVLQFTTEYCTNWCRTAIRYLIYYQKMSMTLTMKNPYQSFQGTSSCSLPKGPIEGIAGRYSGGRLVLEG